MSNQKLIDLRNDMYEMAKKAIVESNGITQTFGMLGENGVTNILDCPWQNEEEKETVFNYIRLLTIAESAVGYFFMSEIWVARYTPNHDTAVRPASREDKEEAILCVAKFRGEEATVTIQRIDRTPEGVTFGAMEYNADGGSETHNIKNLMLDEEHDKLVTDQQRAMAKLVMSMATQKV